jgi:7-carboxy-7-deazaguanine synthase
MDLKAPDSGESAKNRWENLALLNARDEIKIVIASRADYEWARDALRERPGCAAARCFSRRPRG